jgi:membrane-associated phospholipid phosphatase
VNRFDRLAIGDHSSTASVMSDWSATLAVAVPPVADALKLGFTGPLGRDLVVFTEALAVNSALVATAKYTVQRPLPVTYEGERKYLGAQAGYRSFYSGHTSTVVTALTASAWTVRWRYGEQVWPWVMDGVASASVGLERVLAGRHFPTDVIVGAAVGFGVGTAVPVLHRPGGPAVSLSPAPGGLALSGRF